MSAPSPGPARQQSWPDLFTSLMRGDSLTGEATQWAMDEIMAGEATAAQLAAFAVLLRAKGETPAELAGLVRAMLAHAAPVALTQPAVDVVGTGGDRAQTVNISTMAALVTAGSGRAVVKHGNRAASSACGTADVLEELGVAIDLQASGVLATVAGVGIGFCFAPVFHAGMRHASGPRRELGVPTAFNYLGPLTNPARPAAVAIGVYDRQMAPVMAQVLADRGDRGMVFRGDDGLDELTTTTTSQVWLVSDGTVRPDVLDPMSVGIAAADPQALKGGPASFNAEVVRRLLSGEQGPVRDAVLLNAAAAIAAFDGVLDSAQAAVRHGLPIAAAAIDGGGAATLLQAWIELSQKLRADQKR
ncbi:MAG TPA: anthranilate phosphoribosyltransferase [Jatrophihabitans sp.]|jgi:anthranilate phosphoribosyltransferase|uniref:anthranilate phosphoribosyltransferase n=1 Tax=Jatrophihabitans sp. TaxID=1932789 RepID=UPI002F17D11A